MYHPAVRPPRRSPNAANEYERSAGVPLLKHRGNPRTASTSCRQTKHSAARRVDRRPAITGSSARRDELDDGHVKCRCWVTACESQLKTPPGWVFRRLYADADDQYEKPSHE